MRTRCALTALTLPTLWLLLSACGQTPTGAPKGQMPSAHPASTVARLHSQSVQGSTLPATPGQIIAWGSVNSYNYLSNVGNAPTPQAGVSYTAVSASSDYALALRHDGHIVAWGADSYGRVSTAPQPTNGMTFTAVAAGVFSALAIRSDGQIVAWGTGAPAVPALPPGVIYTAVASGRNTQAAVRSDGTGITWSTAGAGDVYIPPAGVKYVSVAAGAGFAVFLRSDGQIDTAGAPGVAGLSGGVPTLAPGVTYTAVATGDTFTLLLTSDGQLKTMGPNNKGELNIPALPSGVTYTAMAATGLDGLALRSDGQIVVWGYHRIIVASPPVAPAGTRYTAIATTSSAGVAIASPLNTAPTAPGVPAVSTGTNLTNTGAFTLSWAASTDQENNPLTYTVEGKSSATDAQSTSVASGITEPTYALSGIAEGTWTYRVRANDGTVDGAASDASASIKVDKSAPTAPTVQVNGAAPTDGWYKDAALVTFSGSTDPALADSSAGSGVASYQGAKTVTSSETATYSGTATDAAGNVSPATTGSVKVDATAPTVAFISCPTSVPQGSVQSLAWTARDAQSGVAGASTGSVTIPTGVVGPQTLTTTSTDAVGHTTTASCTTTVTYPFGGFQQPVDRLPTLNTVKAGSAVPVKFSIGGNYGLNIMTAGTAPVACGATGATDDIEQTVTASTSGLSYDPASQVYTYTWKTDKSWANACRMLTVTLNDGTRHQALFKFR